MEYSSWTSGKVLFTMSLIKHTPTSQASHEISIFGADLTGQDLKELNTTSEIAML